MVIDATSETQGGLRVGVGGSSLPRYRLKGVVPQGLIQVPDPDPSHPFRSGGLSRSSPGPIETSTSTKSELSSV